MNVFITGGGGDIGVPLSERLVASGHGVVVYDRRGEGLPAAVRFVEGDVRDFERLAAAAEGCDCGIHLAALAGGHIAEDTLSVNVLGAYGFLLAARKARFRSAVIASSAPVHLAPSERDNGSPLASSDGDDHAYDLSKALQEEIGRDFHSHGLPVLCLRLGHVVLGEERSNLARSLSLEDEEYCRGGWVALEDVIDASVAALQGTPAPARFERLNIVGAKGGRDRFHVAAAEARLGIRLRYDFAADE